MVVRINAAKFQSSELTDEEMQFILQCQDARLLAAKYRSMLQREYPYRIKGTRKISRALNGALEVSALPIEIFWALSGIGGIGLFILPLSIGLAALAGAGYFYYHYQQQKLSNSYLTEDIQLATMQISIADYLIRREQNKIQRVMDNETCMSMFTPKLNPILPSVAENSNYPSHLALPSKMNALVIGIFATCSFFGSYFWGITSLMSSSTIAVAATAATVMTLPFGTAVAATIAVGLGLYLGYKYYRSKQNLYQAKVERQNLEFEVVNRRSQYNNLHSVCERFEMHHTQSPIRSSYSDSDLPMNHNASTFKRSYSLPNLSDDKVVHQSMFARNRSPKKETLAVAERFVTAKAY